MSEKPSSSSSFAATFRSSLSTMILKKLIHWWSLADDSLQVHRINWSILGRLEYFDGRDTSPPKILSDHFWHSRIFLGLWSDILEYHLAMGRNDTYCDQDRHDSCHCSDTMCLECGPFQMLQQYKRFEIGLNWHLMLRHKKSSLLESYLAI